ncbi:2OG-Fe(II) oxygenase [Algoriphagus chordae]|uniref:Rps23 Pro-64 3,4-dihydroxylase Tpa1-like proline 4-hydroxylase n=1 Tax=Algoriphagus chordae TaxID=237019 RepID=A0A2W7SL59_9BACT|nr:2OG-Fe(II) oxygenase [Algoriphagus chordae]PZX51412.1 Rps23 Pro-64 3,4-dihydroxylase Tpa1-like proline 4-hydroxylase [Algoriphagus chordae]
MEVATLTRETIAKLIIAKIIKEKESLKEQYNQSKHLIGYFYIDNLLPSEIVDEIGRDFPKPEEMTLKKSLRENKHTSSQMNKYHPLLEEVIYAFQDRGVVKEVQDICQIEDLYPDEHLYAGGLSSMKMNQFLNPHLDNSHDKDRNRWRVLNLLFYVTPNWEDKNGGHLELWPYGVENEQITLHSSFNRLIVMATHQSSWHSVSPVQIDGARNCVSNYYFSNSPLHQSDKFHITSFRGRPEQKLRDKVLKMDAYLRSNLRKLFKKGIVENPHVYKKDR